jgi:ABC-type phosphate transport system permease subunit
VTNEEEAGKKDTSAGVNAGNARDTKSKKTKVDPTFKMVLWLVAVLSVLCLATNIAMSILIHTPNVATEHALEITGSAWTTGFGAVLGLLGGKALS